MITQGRSCPNFEIRIHPDAPTFAIDAGHNGITVFAMDAIAKSSCLHEGSFGSNVNPLMKCLRAHGIRVGLKPDLVSGCGEEHTIPMAATRCAKYGKGRHRSISVLMDATGKVNTSEWRPNNTNSYPCVHSTK